MTIQLNGKTPTKICMFQPSRLPAEYQEVEYIESSGTQYLKPGVSHSAGDTIKFEADIFIKGNGCIYGQYTGYSPFNMFQVGIDNGNFFARMNANDNGTLPTTWTPSTYTVNTRYSVVAEGQTTLNQKAPYLLAQNDTNGASWYLSAKLYSFKIYKNGTLQRELVPCYRKADTVIGLYDLVNDTFYTNSGTGTFTKGANIGGEQEIKKIVIFPDGVTEKQIRPAGWQPGANTLFYASLNGNTNSEGILSPTFNSQSGTITYPSLGSIQYAYLNSGQIIWDIGAYTTQNITFQARVSGETAGVISTGLTSWTGTVPNVGIELYFNGSSSWGGYMQNNTSWFGTTVSGSANTRYLITLVKSGTSLSVYKNGGTPQTTTCPNTFNVFNKLYIANNDRSPIANFQIKVSNIIFEDKVRTAQEISDYYNQTKGNYGL